MKVGDLVYVKYAPEEVGIVTKIHAKKSGHRTHTIDVITTSGYRLDRRVPDLFKVIHESR